MNELTSREYAAALREDFCTFVHRCFLELNPQARFDLNWHIELMAAKLDACRQGKIQRLIVNIPPRHLKSICASIALPAFWLGHNPSAQILCVSYGQDLSDKLARDCRNIMMTTWYERLFSTRLSPQKQSVQEFATTEQGFRLATSVGGVLTGRGADVIIIDDPLKPDEAVSDTQRHNVNDWYEGSLYSRLNNKEEGCIIIIMQRLHEDDLVGHVLEKGGWEVVSFPAIAQEDEEHLIETPFWSYRVTRRAGEALHPARESLETLRDIRQTLGEYHFAGQYLQSPAPFGGGMIKEAWFKRYGTDELPAKFDQVVQSWDTANKPTELSDYSVCTTWGLKNNLVYLVHVLRKRLEYPDLKRAVRDQASTHKATVILIEDRASGTQLIQELKAERVSGITPYVPEGDKIMRMNAQTAAIENGLVYVPKEAHWLTDYLHELTTFPSGKYDDQADSTSQALAWIQQSSRQPGLLVFYQEEVQREAQRRGANGTRVDLKAPPGDSTSTVYTMTGRMINVGPDRVIRQLSQEDARPLIAKGWQPIQ